MLSLPQWHPTQPEWSYFMCVHIQSFQLPVTYLTERCM